MELENSSLTLLSWRRIVSDIYSFVRNNSVPNLTTTSDFLPVIQKEDPSLNEKTWHVWVECRDRLLKYHLDSPLDKQQQGRFSNIPYFDYNPSWRILGQVELLRETSISEESNSDPCHKREIFEVKLQGDGQFKYQRIGFVHFTTPNGDKGRLSLFWILGYGGGLFVPFRDSNPDVYGGGRYLFDSIKGADLGVSKDCTQIVLDFNYAYHPSCYYNDRWVCPLAPNENKLAFAITAGEKKGVY